MADSKSARKLTPALRGKTIAIVGGGNMGQALLQGLFATGVPASRLLVVEANPAARAGVVARFRVQATGLEQAVERADLVMLAVKPQDMMPVLQAARSAAEARRLRPLFVSIAAGLQLKALERVLRRCPVVRVMPNLPAKVGCGVSALAGGRWAAAAHLKMARAVFASVGEVVEVPERLFDVVTAVSGSGPAYIFLILEALRDAGIRGGLSKTVAERLAVRTALGSAQLVEALGVPLETLIAQVASKGGTTEAALRVFKARGLASIIQAGVGAASRRSRELSLLLSRA